MLLVGWAANIKCQAKFTPRSRGDTSSLMMLKQHAYNHPRYAARQRSQRNRRLRALGRPKGEPRYLSLRCLNRFTGRHTVAIKHAKGQRTLCFLAQSRYTTTGFRWHCCL